MGKYWAKGYKVGVQLGELVVNEAVFVFGNINDNPELLKL